MFSLINILRQTMTDYSINLQKSLKRNYFQTFQPHEPLSLPPAKTARSDRPTTSTADREDPRRSQNSETQIDRARNPPATVDLTSVDRQQPIDRTNTEPLIDSFRSIVEPPRAHRSPSPVLLKKQKLEPVQIEEPIPVLTRPRIRVVNECIEVPKPSPSRKKPSNSLGKLDENAPSTPARMSTRKSLIKTELIAETPPPFQSIPVILSSSVIAKQWLTHNVFYRCHACSHEEFFVVLSRECMNLHISSKHGNMEENFKRRVGHFLNKKGRTLQIVQHYLKWQQPWPEKEVEQIFALANK